VYQQLVKGYCLAALGGNQKAQLCIQSFVDSKMPDEESQYGAVNLLKAIFRGDSMDLLEINKEKNIKKLGLKNFF
jgi:hypothetical protein